MTCQCVCLCPIMPPHTHLALGLSQRPPVALWCLAQSCLTPTLRCNPMCWGETGDSVPPESPAGSKWTRDLGRTSQTWETSDLLSSDCAIPLLHDLRQVTSPSWNLLSSFQAMKKTLPFPSQRSGLGRHCTAGVSGRKCLRTVTGLQEGGAVDCRGPVGPKLISSFNALLES